MSKKQSIRAYAKAKGQNRNTVRRKLRKAGLAGPVDPDLADKLIDAGTSVKFKQSNEAPEADEAISYNDAERRLKTAKAKQEEIKLDVMAGELIRRDVVTKALFGMGREVRDGLQNLPARLSGILAAESDQERIFAILSKEIQQVLEALSKEVAA